MRTGVLALVVFALVGGAANGFGGGPAKQTAAAVAPGTSDEQVSLYVLDPHMSGGKKGIEVVWLPQPLQKYCIGKTGQQCATIDYCIRTTNKQAKMCQNLSEDTQHITFPAGMKPKRMLSVTYFTVPKIDKFPTLTKYFDAEPAGAFDHLSNERRIKAKVKFTRTADDDGFELEEVLAAPQS